MSGGGTYTPDLEDFRWYNDDSSDLDLQTAIDTQGTNITLATNAQAVLRVRIGEIGGKNGPNTTHKFQYRKNTGTWTDLTTTSADCRFFDGLVADQTAIDGTTNVERLTGGGGNYDSTGGFYQDTNVRTSGNLSADDRWEMACCVQLVNADVAHNDTIQFRVRDTAGSTFTDTAVPQITVNKNVYFLDQTGFRFYDDTGVGIRAANTKLSRNDILIDTPYRCRILFKEQNGFASPAGQGIKVQFSLNGGTWTDLTTTSTPVKSVNSTNVTDGAATSQLLGAGTFDGGFFDEQGDGGGTFTQAASSEREHEFTFQCDDTTALILDTATEGRDIAFRFVESDGTVFPQYTQAAEFFASDGKDRPFYRWRNDDGTETTATWVAAEGTDFSTPTLDSNYRLRFGVGKHAGDHNDPTYTMKLEYRKNGGAWSDMDNVSLNVRSADSTSLTKGAATTQQISSGDSRTFNAGEVDDSNGQVNVDNDTTAASISEHEFCFQFRSADMVNTDKIEFRVVDNILGVELSGVNGSGTGTNKIAGVNTSSGVHEESITQGVNLGFTSDTGGSIYQPSVQTDVQFGLTAVDELVSEEAVTFGFGAGDGDDRTADSDIINQPMDSLTGWTVVGVDGGGESVGGIYEINISNAGGSSGRTQSFTSDTDVWVSYRQTIIGWFSQTSNGDAVRTATINQTSILSGGRAWVGYVNDAGTLKLQAIYIDDADTQQKTTINAVLPTEGKFNDITYHWVAATGIGNNDGIFKVWVDGVLVADITNADTDTQAVDLFCIGSANGFPLYNYTLKQDDLKVGTTGADPLPDWLVQADFEPSTTMGISAGYSATGQADFEPSTTMGISAGYSAVDELSGAIEESVSFGISANLSETVDVDFEPAVSFGVSNSLVTAAEAVFESAISFDISNSLATTAEAIFESAISFDVSNSLATVAEVDFEPAISFDISNNLSESADVVFEPSATFAVSLGYSAVDELQGAIEESITFDISTSLSTTTDVDFEPTAAFDVAADLSETTDAVHEPSVSFDTSLDVVAQGGLLIDSAAAFNIQLDYSADNEKTLEEAVAFATTHGQAVDSQADFEDAVAFNTQLDLAHTSEAVFEEAVTFNNALAYASSVSLLFDNSVSFNVQLDYSAVDEIAAGVIEESIVFAVQTSLVNSSLHTMEESVTLDTVFDKLASGIMIIDESLDIAVAAGMGNTAENVIEQTVAFNAQFQDSVQASATFEEAVTVSVLLDAAYNTEHLLEESVVFTVENTMTVDGIAVMEGSITLATQLDAAYVADIGAVPALVFMDKISKLNLDQYTTRIKLNQLTSKIPKNLFTSTMEE